jgi:uncharacterized protein YecT (DUF1311 family)
MERERDISDEINNLREEIKNLKQGKDKEINSAKDKLLKKMESRERENKEREEEHEKERVEYMEELKEEKEALIKAREAFECDVLAEKAKNKALWMEIRALRCVVAQAASNTRAHEKWLITTLGICVVLLLLLGGSFGFK